MEAPHFELILRGSGGRPVAWKVQLEDGINFGIQTLTDWINALSVAAGAGWAGPFDTPEDGISGTTDGDVFYVIDVSGFRLFRNDDGDAETLTYLAAAGVWSNWERSIYQVVPPIAVQMGGDLTATPADTPYFNISMGHGARDAAVSGIWRSTFYGTMVGSILEEAERTEAFGSGAMRFARYSSRNTAIGSLAMQWLGQEKEHLTELYHDLWWPIPPTDPEWDVSSMETLNPGIRTKIADAEEASSADDVRGNVGVGRDSLLHLINGIFNTAVGYRALARAFRASNNAAFGRDALAHNVLASNNTALGDSAGWRHQEGDYNTFVGAGAGLGHVTGYSNVFLGGGAGYNWDHCFRSVLIGPAAGQGQTPQDQRLLIQNMDDRIPLIGGQFNTGRVGINIDPTDASDPAFVGALHVRMNGGAFVVGGPAANMGARTLVLEHTETHGMTFMGGEIQNIYFGDADDNNMGGVSYNHSTDRMILRADDTGRIAIGAGTLVLIDKESYPTSADGLETGRVWIDGDALKVA